MTSLPAGPGKQEAAGPVRREAGGVKEGTRKGRKEDRVKVGDISVFFLRETKFPKEPSCIKIRNIMMKREERGGAILTSFHLGIFCSESRN